MFNTQQISLFNNTFISNKNINISLYYSSSKYNKCNIYSQLSSLRRQYNKCTSYKSCSKLSIK